MNAPVRDTLNIISYTDAQSVLGVLLEIGQYHAVRTLHQELERKHPKDEQTPVLRDIVRLIEESLSEQDGEQLGDIDLRGLRERIERRGSTTCVDEYHMVNTIDLIGIYPNRPADIVARAELVNQFIDVSIPVDVTLVDKKAEPIEFDGIAEAQKQRADSEGKRQMKRIAVGVLQDLHERLSIRQLNGRTDAVLDGVLELLDVDWFNDAIEHPERLNLMSFDSFRNIIRALGVTLDITFHPCLSDDKRNVTYTVTQTIAASTYRVPFGGTHDASDLEV